MILYQVIEGFVVRMEGLEPPCREALDPKSSASTNFATSAVLPIQINIGIRKLERQR